MKAEQQAAASAISTQLPLLRCRFCCRSLRVLNSRRCLHLRLLVILSKHQAGHNALVVLSQAVRVPQVAEPQRAAGACRSLGPAAALGGCSYLAAGTALSRASHARVCPSTGQSSTASPPLNSSPSSTTGSPAEYTRMCDCSACARACAGRAAGTGLARVQGEQGAEFWRQAVGARHFAVPLPCTP